MRKKIIIILHFLLLPFFICSCHGTLTSNQNSFTSFIVPEELNMNKHYSITFWSKNDSNNLQQKVYQDAAFKFHQLYPNIDIIIQQYTDYTMIYNDVINNVATNTTPNVCIAYPDHVATYLTGQLITPLDSLISNEKYGLGGSMLRFDSVSKEDIVEQFLNEGIIQNHYYLLPFMRSTEALYINETMVEELGCYIPDIVTWDWVWETCAKAKLKYPDDDFYPFIYKSTDNMFIQLLKQHQYQYSDTDGNLFFYNDNVAKMLLEIGEKYDKKLFTTFKKVSYPGNHFNIEKCLMAVDSTAGATWIGSNCPAQDHQVDNDNKKSFKTAVKMIPQINPNNPKMISQGPSICIFNKEDSEEVLASWLFAQYLLNLDTQLSYAKTEGYSPVTTTAIESTSYQQYLQDENEYSVKLAATKLVSTYKNYTFTAAVFNGSTLVRSASGYLIEGMSGKNYRSIESIYQLFQRSQDLYQLTPTSGLMDQTINIKDKLPNASIFLLVTMGVVWTGIIIYIIVEKRKRK